MKENRNSNIELYRIIIMILIVAHHYLVHSGLVEEISNNFYSFKTIYLLTFGAWGKTGINCFILITGYFMSISSISLKKWLKLTGKIVFYNIVIYLLFVISGYEVFSLKIFIKTTMPIWNLSTGFTSCYLIFYLFIPFINLLILNMNEKQHINLLILCLSVYTIWGSLPFITVSMNYITWFMVVYLIGAYIRLYPKKIYTNYKLWSCLTIFFILLSIASIILLSKFNYGGLFFLADSNKIFAVLVSVSSFILFVNLPISYNKYINLIGGSTFGVLLIHTCCDSMLLWLWRDILKTPQMYTSSKLYIHSIISVICVFTTCVIIDLIRKKIGHYIFKKIGC